MRGVGGWGLCQHCLHQMPGGGGGITGGGRAFMTRQMGVGICRVPVCETERRERHRDRPGERGQ